MNCPRRSNLANTQPFVFDRAGALAGWADRSGASSFDSKSYFINGYASAVPKPAALGLMLARLALFGRATTRRRGG
ncbi:MAG: hypothetical protein O9321_21180 [Rubrivivax sp.]|jgi:hypothetical protein|nr:hypothetical protein [Rubrivivax sp.]